jgi:hypothetical protein
MLNLSYRESHAWARTRVAQRFNDVQRYMLLGLTYAWL